MEYVLKECPGPTTTTSGYSGWSLLSPPPLLLYLFSPCPLERQNNLFKEFWLSEQKLGGGPFQLTSAFCHVTQTLLRQENTKQPSWNEEGKIQ